MLYLILLEKNVTQESNLITQQWGHYDFKKKSKL